MNIIAELFKVLVVSSVVWTFNFIRKHPWITLILFLLAVVIPFLVNTLPLAGLIYGLVRKALDWFRGGVTITEKIIRVVLLFSISFVFPLWSLLYALMLLMDWIFQNVAVQPATLTPLPDQNELDNLSGNGNVLS